ncbi:MAG: NADH:ubiquinone reductase (Na(+)-transporting) subunit C [Candidatus Amulumruptor caecigallinarius]|nr:NADH:ubiquinone reductase (Na(+)-transporting) subunit C [Candidatus Amulumruptor caecigallinarius]
MNRQSNTYTIIYAAILVAVVGVVLSMVYQALRPQQEENISNDTKRQILAAALITPDNGQSVSDLYAEHIRTTFIVNSKGEKVDSGKDPFKVNIALESKKPTDERELPVFVCSTTDGDKYILPVYGSGLWGPIWGYVALDSNGDTIYGAYFAHQGETPGLGAEIEKPTFSGQFKGKNIFNAAGGFTSVKVVKAGQEPSEGSYVHAVSGGTITSQGVQKMLVNSLQPYSEFLKNLAGADTTPAK